MAPHTPPLLSPYLSLPSETSLILLTSVLGSSTNWLVLRYIHSLLSSSSPETGSRDTVEGGRALDGGIDSGEETKIVLVSFMRDWSFWREGCRKLGIDIQKLSTQNRFAFVDGLTSLFLPKPKNSTGTTAQKSSNSTSNGVVTLQGASYEQVYSGILNAIKGLGGGKVVLIVDQLDFLLAAAGENLGYTPVTLGEMVINIRMNVHSTILSLAADAPLVLEQHTPLEVNHSSFLLSMAHQAGLILGLRLLDTGAARDVSGVIRITREDDVDGEEGREGGGTDSERELLYYIGGDGGVRVFERGQ